MRYRVDKYRVDTAGELVWLYFMAPEGVALSSNPDNEVEPFINEAIRLIVDESSQLLICSSMKKDGRLHRAKCNVETREIRLAFSLELPEGKTIHDGDLFTIEMDWGDTPFDGPKDYAKENTVAKDATVAKQATLTTLVNTINSMRTELLQRVTKTQLDALQTALMNRLNEVSQSVEGLQEDLAAVLIAMTKLSLQGDDASATNTEILRQLQTIKNDIYMDILKEIKEVTYSGLKAMRDNGLLVPGQYYRITDYVTTVNAPYKDVRSAGHPFDIIVFALSTGVLSETAYAIAHGGDNDYFANSKLGAWKLRYSLDNTEHSLQKGTYVQTEGYSFKKAGTITLDGTEYILWKGDSNYVDDWAEYAVSEGESVNDTIYAYYDDEEFSDESIGDIVTQSVVSDEGKGTILWMMDEFSNECKYDFKNLQFKRWRVVDNLHRDNTNDKYIGVLNRLPVELNIEDEDDFIWAYTYAVHDYSEGGMETLDHSLRGRVSDAVNSFSMSKNVVCVWENEDYYAEQVQLRGYMSAVTFSGNLRNTTFSGDLNRVSFSGSLYNTSFSGSLSNTTFSGYLDRVSFSGYLSNVSFSGSLSNTTFSGSLGNTTFSGNLDNTTFSGYLSSVSFSGYLDSVSFSGYLYRTTFSGELWNTTFSGNLKNSVITGELTDVRIEPSNGASGTINCLYTFGKISNKTITVANNSTVPTYAAMTSAGVLKVWNPAD